MYSHVNFDIQTHGEKNITRDKLHQVELFGNGGSL
jgi:hypothetical protein